MPIFVPYAKHKLKKTQNISVVDFDDGPIQSYLSKKRTHAKH